MISRHCCLIVACTLLFCACAAAQTPGFSFTNGSASETDHFVVDVDVVDVFFNVRSGEHQLMPGLPREEFELLENGRPQQIRYFSPLAQQPLRIALMIDTSGSQNRVLDQEKIVAGSFLEQVLTPGDAALIVTFDSDIELRHDFEGSARELRASLEGVRRIGSKNSATIGAVGHPKLRSTALYDALHLTAKHRFDDLYGRKVFIIITDGEDQGSVTSATDAINDAIHASAICYVLLVADSAVSNRARYSGEKRMAELTKQTGGRLIRVGRKLKELPRYFDEISTELRNQYSIGYTPTNRAGTGEYRRIQIRSRRGYQVQSRQGYFARFGKPRDISQQ